MYNILIIDSDAKSRAMLKDVALCLPSFKKVLFCSTLQEGINFVNSQTKNTLVIGSESHAEVNVENNNKILVE